MKMIHPHVTVDNDEDQGLVFNFDYKKCLSRYCSIDIAKSDNVPTETAVNLKQSNAATVSLIKALGINGEHETLASLVSNSVKVFQESKCAYPKWRDTDRIVRSIYIQKALTKRAEEQGRNQYAITMRFSPKLAQKIMAGGAAYIQEALARQLRRSLGYTPDMWLHLEATVSKEADKNHNYMINGKGSVSHSRGLLHMHGAISLSRSDLDVVKRVVRSLNDSTSAMFQNHELRLKPINKALGWVNYCHKDTSTFLNNNILLCGITRYSRSTPLSSVAQELYEADRQRHKTAHGTTYGKGK